MPDPTTLEKLEETIKRARDNAPAGPGLMPQPRVPQDPPRPWSDTDTDEDTDKEDT